MDKKFLLQFLLFKNFRIDPCILKYSLFFKKKLIGWPSKSTFILVEDKLILEYPKIKQRKKLKEPINS
jgi:hypothetical protein